MWGSVLDLVLPSSCAGCGRVGSAWCRACDDALGPPAAVALPGLRPPGAARSRPVPVRAAGAYGGGLRAAVLAFKERGRRELARPLGVALARAVSATLGEPGPSALSGPSGPSGASGSRGSPGRAVDGSARPVWLVPAPSRAAATRRRGGDHVELLARHAAAALTAAGIDARCVPLLRLARGARDSVGLDAAARAANLAGRVRVRRVVARAVASRAAPTGLAPPGVAVVLVDDVATTGATIAECRAVLARAHVDLTGAAVLASAAPLVRTSGLRDRSVITTSSYRTPVRRTA